MKFTVTWRETALQQLAQVWMDAPNREAVNQEVDLIDLTLGDDPDRKGDDYFGDRYVVFPVLWALYLVKAEDRIVEVLQVGRNGRDLPHENLPPPE